VAEAGATGNRLKDLRLPIIQGDQQSKAYEKPMESSLHRFFTDNMPDQRLGEQATFVWLEQVSMRQNKIQ
jgi:hypothetical protein